MTKLLKKYPVLLPLLFGLVLRLIHAGGRSLRFEEGLIAQIVQENVRGVIIASTQNSTPYVFNLLVHVLVTLFGRGQFVLCLVSIISGTALIAVTYYFTKRYFSETSARIAAYLVAVSPFLIYYSQEVRPYSLLSLFAFCSAYVFIRALETNRFVFWAATAILNILCVYTQPIGWLYVFAEAIYFALFFKRHRRALPGWLISTILVGLYYLPQREFNKMLVEYMAWHFISPANVMDFFAHTLRRFFGTIMHFMSGYYFYNISPDIFENSTRMLFLLLMAGIPTILLIFGSLYMLKKRKAVNLYIWLLFLAPVSLIWMDGTSPRYYIMGTVPFLIICALGLSYLGRKLQLIGWILIVFTSAVALGDIYSSPTSTFSPENPRDVSRFVAQSKKPGDVVYYIGGINGTHTWKYYNPQPHAFVSGTPFWSEHFYGIRPSAHPDEYLQYKNFSVRIDPLLKKYHTVWLVMQGSRHRTIAQMINALKNDYDITLLYNQDWLAVAAVRGKIHTMKSDPSVKSGTGTR